MEMIIVTCLDHSSDEKQLKFIESHGTNEIAIVCRYENLK